MSIEIKTLVVMCGEGKEQESVVIPISIISKLQYFEALLRSGMTECRTRTINCTDVSAVGMKSLIAVLLIVSESGK
jgi:hypothetical protein